MGVAGVLLTEDPAVLEGMIKMRKTGMCEICMEKKETERLSDDWNGETIAVEICHDCYKKHSAEFDDFS
jgi:hypothetical protein